MARHALNVPLQNDPALLHQHLMANAIRTDPDRPEQLTNSTQKISLLSEFSRVESFQLSLSNIRAVEARDVVTVGQTEIFELRHPFPWVPTRGQEG